MYTQAVILNQKSCHIGVSEKENEEKKNLEIVKLVLNANYYYVFLLIFPDL